MASRPTYSLIAVAVALLPWPALMLLDRMNSNCGDGLCSFIPGIIILGGLAVATLFCLVRSSRLDETPGLLRVVPLLLWGLTLIPLVR